MGDETRKPQIVDGEIRSLAVEIVDMVHGFTVEFSNAPNGHALDYDQAEAIIRRTLGTVAPPGAVTEVRTIVKGWKMQGGQRREFVGHHLGDCSRSESARIGVEGLPDWQPHITEVVVEERVVTPWAAALAPSPQSESEQT